MPEFQLMESFGPNKMPSGWLGKFLKFAIVLFVIVTVVYFLFHYVYLSFLDKKIAEIENNIKGLENEIPTQDREEVTSFYSQLVNLKTLLEKHLYSSLVFERLELITHPQVAFSSFEYDFQEGRLMLNGTAQDLQALAQQLLAFQKTTDFSKIELSDVRQGTNKLNFSVEIFFKPSFLLKNFE
jgi:hypothetical protein